MILRYLKLNNFLSHQSTELEFSEMGMFLLSGESGAGKSSLIIDATAYSLFGPAAVTRAKSHNEIILAGSESMSVQALFELENEKLLIERGMNPKPYAKVFIVENDQAELIGEGAKEVNRVINKRLGGLNWRQFFAAFVARQSEISKLTELRGNERKDMIHKMLGMRELEEASKITSDKTKRNKAEIDQLRISVGGFDPEAAAAEIRETKNEKDQLLKQINNFEKSLGDETLEIQKLTEEFEKIKPGKIALEKLPVLEGKQIKLKAEIETVEKKAELASQIKEKISSGHALKEKRKVLSEDIDKLRKEYAHADKFKQVKAEQERFSAMETVSMSYPELTADQAEIKAQISAYRQREKEIKEIIERICDDPVCYACKRTFNDDQERQQVNADLNQELKDINENVSQLEIKNKNLADSTETVKRSDKIKDNLERILQELDKLGPEPEASLEDLLEKGQQQKVELEQIDRQIAEIEVLEKQYDPQAIEKLAELTKQMEDLETELNSVKETAKDADPGKITAREDRLNQLNNNVNETKIRIEEANKQLKGVVSRLEALEKEHAGRSKELAELEKYRKESSVIENVATCLKGFQKHLAEEIRPALEEIGSEMLASISAGKHVAMHIDNNYEIMVEDNKGNMQRAAILSGGEQIRANICLRLALTRLVSQRTGIPVGFLIFDEPLPSQDPGHIERIMQLLDSLRGFYQQQFIISHVGDLQSADEINYIVEFDSNTTPQLVNA